MSENSFPKYSSSASDGNLTELEGESFENKLCHRSEDIGHYTSEVEKQVYFTLPRWMSSRKKSRRKVKDIKVDVPLKANDREVPKEESFTLIPKRKKKIENPISILNKLFKKSFTYNSTSVPKELVVASSYNQLLHHRKESTYVSPISHTISSSNTDIRSHIVKSDTPDLHDYFRGKTPALCGIKNHGNTCFMNAVIQCLSNTDFFAEYFVMDQYKIDFLRRNKIHAKKYGTKGEVTEQLATLLQCLWSYQYCPEISYKFKHLVAKYGSQWEGNNQHDAQEFLLWLLDKVHEDLNTAPKQKYRKPKNTYGRPDEVLAAETMANHLRCNSSFIHDLFQGQLRSSLSCPGCGQCSNTFDPYLCISLPVPHCQTTVIFINLVLVGKDKDIRIGLAVDLHASVKTIKEKINTNYAVSRQRIVLTEFTGGEFQRTFCDSDSVSVLKESDELYAFETPLIKPSSSEGEQMVLIVINRVLHEENKPEIFWKPFVVQVSREADFKAIQAQVLKGMSCIMKSNGSEADFQLRVIDGVPVHEILPHTVDLPLYMPIVDQALTLCDSIYTRGPQHLKIAAEWQQAVKEKFIEEKPFLEEDSTALNLKHLENKVPNSTLYECFDMYFKEEKLGIEDAWMCPYCHRRLQGVKKLSLWSLPDVFIVHLKRFRQAYCQRTKVTTLVEFPLLGLDMNPYFASKKNDVPSHAGNGSISQVAVWSPWRRSRSELFPKCEDNIYNLYAVCNHHGSMQGGHYAAYCKNPVDGHWYLYDDEKVQMVQDSEVMTANGYILFYQRSTLSTHSCASSSTSGYSSASSTSLIVSDHWAFRMPPFLHVPKTSKSQDNLSNFLGFTTLDRRMNSENRPFTRAARSYSSMIQTTDKSAPLSATNNEERHSDGEAYLEDAIPPPPPPPVKRYWTITSV